MTDALKGNSLAQLAADDQVKASLGAIIVPSLDPLAKIRRRHFYGIVWRTAARKAWDRAIPSTVGGIVTTGLSTIAAYFLGDTVGPALLSMPRAVDGEGKAILAVMAVVIVAAIRGLGILADELLTAPVQFWSDGKQETALLTGQVATLQNRVTELLTPALELYAHDLTSPPFFQEDGAIRGQYIVKIELRTRHGVRTVRGVQVRLHRAVPIDGSPELHLDAAAPLEIQGGTTKFGIDVHPGDQRFAQLLVVRPAAARALPAVRIFYWPTILTECYGPLPNGEWLLELHAIGEDTSPDIRHVLLKVTSDLDPKRRVRVELLPAGADDEKA